MGTDTAKELLFARLKINEAGPGYCHFPLEREEEYFKMLTAEKKVLRYFKGRPKREWIKTRQRNEALDCRVYAMAALQVMGINIEAVSKQQQNSVGLQKKHVARRPGLPRSNSFVHGYR